ncbi:hypothetical protein [Ilumatobacter sp.]|uniref:hypothetical protein n=1 Tax=Ilumatobacter sp. TaxID=1967498 RepID=UPI003B52553C
MSTDVQAWTLVLDRIEDGLDRMHDALEHGRAPDPADLLTPGDLGPIPAECAEQARRIAGRNLALIGLVSDHLEENPPPPTARPHQHVRPSPAGDDRRFEFRA